jgi:methionine synthase II (cobalamin-independent)
MQLRHGIDILSDGEQRYDMIDYFHQIPGLTRVKGKLSIGKKIESVSDLDEFIKIKDFKFVKNYLRENGKTNLIKTSITGPITLGTICAMNGVGTCYKNIKDPRIYEDLCEALGPIIKRLLELGSLVQIDEPGLSGGFIGPNIGVKIINDLIKNSVNKQAWMNNLSIHACGNLYKIKSLFDELLKIDAKTLSLAFSGKQEMENLNLLSERKIEKYDKKIGVGCANIQLTSIKDVDGAHTIIERLRKILKLVGRENIAYVHPDCGLRNSSIEITLQILKNIEESLKLLAL